MAKITDLQIKAWIKNNERFEGKSDGDGLYLSYRENFAIPVWRFRYKIKGATRWITMGSYSDLSVAEARRQSKELRARVALGYDVAEEKQDRKTAAINKLESKKTAYTSGELADEYFTKNILGRWKHPNIVRSRIEKDIKPYIGKIPVDEVKPMHCQITLKTFQ